MKKYIPLIIAGLVTLMTIYTIFYLGRQEPERIDASEKINQTLVPASWGYDNEGKG